LIAFRFMPITSDGKAPYAPPKAVTDVVTAYRDRGLQTPFTQDVLIKAGVSETLAPRTLLSLKLLDLINDDGEPTQEFEGLRKAPSDEFQERFAAVLKAVYAEVFSYVDPRQDSPDRVRDAFRSYAPTGQQERMVTLFLGLCAFAGIVDESSPKRRPGPRVGASRRKGGKPPKARNAPQKTPDAKTGFLGIPDPPQSQAAGGHPFIQGLLRELPPIGTAWPKAERQAWLDAQAAAFNLLYSEKSGGGDPDT
jgi:hypothetical protein